MEEFLMIILAGAVGGFIFSLIVNIMKTKENITDKIKIYGSSNRNCNLCNNSIYYLST